MATQAQLILRDDNGTVVNLLDGTNFDVLPSGIDYSDPILRADGLYEDATVTVRIELQGQSTNDALVVQIQKLRKLIFEAEQFEEFGWGPRVELQHLWGQSTSAAASTANRLTEPVYADVVSGSLRLPQEVWAATQLMGQPAIGTEGNAAVLSLRCKYPWRGHEEEFENLLLNPSFERGTAPGESWVTVGGATNTLDTAHKYHGLQSLKIVGVNNADGAYQAITLTANRAYQLSCWVYVTAGTFEIRIVDQINVVDVSAVDVTQAANSAWTRLSFIFVTNSVTSYRVNLNQIGAPALTAWVDAVMLTPYEPVFDMDCRGLWHMESNSTCTPTMGLPGGDSSTYNLTVIGAPSATTTGAVRRQGIVLSGVSQYAWLNNKLTDIYEDDGGVFSANRASTAAFKLHDLNVDDAAYFGDTRGKFNQLMFHVGTARVGGTSTWEYWNGAWVALTIIDDTGPKFATLGRNIASFTAPSDWATTSVNGVTAYWVRNRVTALVTTAPQNATTEVNRSGIFEDLTGSFTLTLFFKTGADVASLQALLSKNITSGPTRASSFLLMLSDAVSKGLTWRMTDSAGVAQDCDSEYLLSASTWYFCAVGHDATNDVNEIWIAALDTDTKVTKVGRITGITNDMRVSAAVFMVGGYDDGVNPDSGVTSSFGGTIDEVSVHGSALAEPQLNRILTSGLQKYRTLNGGSETPKAWVGTRSIYEREDSETGITNRFDFRDIPGDYPSDTDIFIYNTAADARTDGQVLCGLRRLDTLLFKMFWSHLDVTTAGTDITTVADSNSIDGNIRRCSYATQTALSGRLSWSPTVRSSSQNTIGTFRVFVRLKSGSGNTLSARIRLIASGVSPSSTASNLFTGLTYPIVASTFYRLYDLGDVTYPPVSLDKLQQFSENASFQIALDLGRSAGAANTDVDFIMLLPTGEGSWAAKIYYLDTTGTAVPSLPDRIAVHISGIQHQAWVRNQASDYLVQTPRVIDFSGAFLTLAPAKDGALFFTHFGGDNFDLLDPLTAVYAVRLRYRPQYALARGD